MMQVLLPVLGLVQRVVDAITTAATLRGWMRRKPSSPAPLVAALAFAAVTEAEVQVATALLYGHRPQPRKRQRRRYHLTYTQRDQVADVLLRLHHERQSR